MPKIINQCEIINFSSNRLLKKEHQYKTLPPLDEDLVADILSQLAQEYSTAANFNSYREENKTDFANSPHGPGSRA